VEGWIFELGISSEEKSRPSLIMPPEISVIIPVKNGGHLFEECLLSITATQVVSYEIIVVDDCSIDNTPKIARKYSHNVISLPQSVGPAHARNIGARAAQGDILFFIDSDVMIFSDTLQKIKNIFQDITIMAITGIQSENNRFKNFFSEYKNLWMRYTYLTLPQTVALFYTSSSAIRRKLFFESGGFNIGYRRPSVEDSDYGQTLDRMGYAVHLIKDLVVENAKPYSLSSILRTDFFRSADLSKLTLRNGLKRFFLNNKTSVPSSFVAGVILFLLTLPIIAATIFFPVIRIYSLFLFFLIVAYFLLLNRAFLLWAKSKKGGKFFLQALLFLSIDIPVIASGMCFGIIDYVKGRHY
jgi:glycosyltransferase involved in cell wall biosynthesis